MKDEMSASIRACRPATQSTTVYGGAPGRPSTVGWSRTKEADEVAGVVIRLLAVTGMACTGIFTFDNGKEFARHGEIPSALKADVFFARRHHSWEWGTNENTNGLILRLYPKSESFATIGEADRHVP